MGQLLRPITGQKQKHAAGWPRRPPVYRKPGIVTIGSAVVVDVVDEHRLVPSCVRARLRVELGWSSPWSCPLRAGCWAPVRRALQPPGPGIEAGKAYSWEGVRAPKRV